jgi:hypothetical protein
MLPPSIWKSDLVDLSSPDRITLAGITLEGEICVSIRNSLVAVQKRVLVEHGERAFECPKEAAAIHEAGHVVVNVALGGRVRRVDIDCHPSGAWIGYTEYLNGEWSLSPETATSEKWLEIARNLYAGVAAEMLFDPDFRQGSSLDEVVMSQWIGGEAAHLVNEDPASFWTTHVDRGVADILRKHRDVHGKIVANLMRRGFLKGLPLSDLCRRIRIRS